MFIEEILKIDNLVFKPQDELKKAKYNRIELFEDGWQNIILPNPPKNSSTETRNEIEEIKKRYDQKTDEDIQQYINSDEDSSYYIKLVLEENNMDYDSNTVEYIEDQCRPIIRHYKNHYNRTRPYQVAEALGIDFEKFETGTSKTPSYPSGHTVQPYVVANYYGKLYPELKSELRQAADISGFGRVIAGLHFPSDYKAGIMLADQLYQYIKFDTISEDAPLNSTGDAVQTNHPLMYSKSLYRRKNQQDTKRLYKLLKKRYN